MTKVDLMQNFARVFRTMEANGTKQTNFAKAIGFTSTTQLHNSIAGKSFLSSKAIVAMIEELNVNPLYLFLGKGGMFMEESDEDEIANLKNENTKLMNDLRKAVDTVMTLGMKIHDMEKMYSKLAEVHSDTLKYYKAKDVDETTEKDAELNKSE